jgi:hypothetical protein
VIGSFERAGPWQVATSEELAPTGSPVRAASHRYLVTAVEPLPAYTDALVSVAAIEINRRQPVGHRG